MRRVNEAVREVLSDAIKLLKDPRVGFVTVTDVQHQPRSPPRQGVRERPRHRRGAGRHAGRGCASAHGVLQAVRQPRAADEAHADAGVRLRRHGRARRPARADARRRGARSVIEPRRRPRRAPRRRALHPRHAREPRRRRARLARRDAQRAARARQGQRDVHVRRRVPAALRVPLLRPRGPGVGAAAGHRRAHGDLPGLRQHRPQPARDRQARRHPHRQRRPPPRQHALRHDQLGRRRRLLHRGARLVPDARPRRRADADDRRGALRRPRHRHGPLHVREHRARART